MYFINSCRRSDFCYKLFLAGAFGLAKSENCQIWVLPAQNCPGNGPFHKVSQEISIEQKVRMWGGGQLTFH